MGEAGALRDALPEDVSVAFDKGGEEAVFSSAWRRVRLPDGRAVAVVQVAAFGAMAVGLAAVHVSAA